MKPEPGWLARTMTSGKSVKREERGVFRSVADRHIRREIFIGLCFVAASLSAAAVVLSSCIKMQELSGAEGEAAEGEASILFSLDRASLEKAGVIADSSFVHYGTENEVYSNAGDIWGNIDGNSGGVGCGYPAAGGAGRATAGLYPEGSIRDALDTNNYLLRITGSSGTDIYCGKYTERPSCLYVKPGTYTVGLESRKFLEPEFLYPLFGESRSVRCKKDSTVHIALKSSQLTGGIRFVFTEKFTSYFKGTGIYLRRDTIERKYRYTDSRYLFFREGRISVYYKNKDGHSSYTPPDRPGYEDTLLFYRKLQPEELVTITLDYDLTKVGTGGMTITVDTLRVRSSDYHNVAGIAPFGCQSILEARKSIGDTITVFGYIVGTDATSTGFNRVKPFRSKTHIVIASQSWQTLREKTIAVELPETDKMRQRLNLADHPELLKRPIVVSGRVVDSYFGHPGLKYVKSYLLL